MSEIPTVASFVREGWWTPAPDAETTTIRDAATGEEIWRVGTAGLDLAGAVAHARTVGQESLGALTFHQRALLLKQFALALQDRKDELYALSACAGATARDCATDVDGGIGVLFTYASKGRRELPNARVVVDGPAEPLSKDGSFLGRHVYTRLPGVAVQINAFNFPVWGALEKLAPAFLAGVPTIVKPATPTAYLAATWVRILVDAGLVPAGTLQLVSGPVPDLFELLGLGDLVAFTGSADTAARLRARARPGVRFTTETDSINASVLGPDAVAGTPEFDAYVRQLFVELTTKAGQKCTAIRRAIVPEGAADAVVDALRAMIAARTVLGDPRAEGVTMGPLVSLMQRDEVRRQVARLQEGGGRIVLGSLDAPEVRRTDGSTGAAPDGAFLAPLLLRFRPEDAGQDAAVHTVEAFGPVAGLLTYRTVDEAADLVARGGGSLVTSVATADPEVATRLLDRIGAYNGRILFLDRDDARTSTGHGAPVPHLVHGGPGRAGGGEELGGIRAVLHHMQRTAVQGSPRMLTALTGVWHAGAPAQAGGIHPFRKTLADLRLGDRIDSAEREVTLADIETFARFTGDTFYAHMDETAAAANPFFPGRVAHGYLLVSFAAGLFVDPDPGPVLANYGLENLRFVTPVSPGDRIRVALTAKQITPRETDEYGEVRWDAVIHNDRDEVVASYDVLTLVAKE
ncbi:phenylacetic acid degradation bifunctional protein PaaZ [Microbacterium aurum]|uniref:Phenylacetic acid degradation bifunctional protein PaaZ n=1 Tax=Microbacterium aurum TaxID=36805 RepID=A0A1P8UB54_9MICO|nr:phenylacetic acid degradation bifunctional protein PaaZ [Microbacterium aurum]APZ35352.1 phenylacetic acid degradation bifunctional protein PaaZ [Microbacterium aurum]MBM7826002.1 oxepin-CoA hydrolase/3-oxo-5,6-dehydrosuberyl-CoA semialdehyde dehydrogenase [Microbacterium aurum]